MAEKINKKYGRALAHIRVLNGLSQEEAGKIVGLGRSHIANLETGRYRISLKHFHAFRRAWNFSADEFLDLAEKDFILGPPGRPRASSKSASVT